MTVFNKKCILRVAIDTLITREKQTTHFIRRPETHDKDQKIAKLGKEITDRATVLLGKDKITPNSPEYLGINSALKYTAYKYDQKMADDILDICLTMKSVCR